MLYQRAETTRKLLPMNCPPTSIVQCTLKNLKKLHETYWWNCLLGKENKLCLCVQIFLHGCLNHNLLLKLSKGDLMSKEASAQIRR